MSAALGTWMNGEFVGTWAVDRASHSFVYDPSWLKSSKVRSLSLSLPITSSREVRGNAVASYFDNLLPDNDRIKERLSRRFKTKNTEAFSLLEAIGRDCVGAVQLLPQGQSPEGWNRVDCDPLSESQIVDILNAVPTDGAPGPSSQWGGGDDDVFRVSIAGAQEKTAFVKVNGQWCRPHSATPTTHIFKLPLGLVGGSRRVDLSDSVQNEWVCAQIAAELGLPVAPVTLTTFGDQTVLVVERFDREWMDGGAWIARLPQEDFCQALGIPPKLKYENDGGPGMSKCLKLLSRSTDSQRDVLTFQLAQLAFWLMAATDGHAKNYSIFLDPGDEYVMTPLYDILSMWPYFGPRPNQFNRKRAGLAMAMRSKSVHYAFDTIQTRHWHQLAMKNGGATAWGAMCTLVDQVKPALGAVEMRLPHDFPSRTWDAISHGMLREAGRFQSGLTGL